MHVFAGRALLGKGCRVHLHIRMNVDAVQGDIELPADNIELQVLLCENGVTVKNDDGRPEMEKVVILPKKGNMVVPLDIQRLSRKAGARVQAMRIAVMPYGATITRFGMMVAYTGEFVVYANVSKAAQRFENRASEHERLLAQMQKQDAQLDLLKMERLNNADALAEEWVRFCEMFGGEEWSGMNMIGEEWTG